MFVDAHCHPFDLQRVYPQFDKEPHSLKILAAASSCNIDEFYFNEELAKKTANEGEARIFPCFAIHPQQGVISCDKAGYFDELLVFLEKLAAEKRISAVGECGFDLYNERFRKTEKWQEKIFTFHLEIAKKYDLPLVFHVRRSIHKIFKFSNELKKCLGVIFHSWAGTLEEGEALLRRRVNAYFSFGNTILNGHKQAIRCCSNFPAERILTETDAPYQAARGDNFSSWADLPHIVKAAAKLRNTCAKELENQIENNFRHIFNVM